MSSKRTDTAVQRRIVTMILLAGISVSFLAIYYFVYLPQQRELYNAGVFRTLHQIALNFQQRIDNYGTVKTNSYISNKFRDTTIAHKKIKDVASFNKIFWESFGKSIPQRDSFYTKVQLERDTVYYNIYSRKLKSKNGGDSSIIKHNTPQPLSEILEPLISVYSGTFQSVFLISQAYDDISKNVVTYDTILYKPVNSEIDIGNINTDSLFTDKNLQGPAVKDVVIEDIPYKIFLLPFKMTSYSSTLVFTGIMLQDDYNQQVQKIPVFFLLGIIAVITILLLASPFLKIFLLGAHETVKLTDVRTIISVIFIFPFLFTLLCAALWIYSYENNEVEEELNSLQENITGNFYREISQCLQQEKEYDSILQNPSSVLLHSPYNSLSYSNKPNYIKAKDLKDVIFHPRVYKNFTSLHWMNDSGYDIAAWSFSRRNVATYFSLADRTYFQDIKYGRGYKLPQEDDKGYAQDSFSIQPILSRLTGDYSISISAKSNDTISNSNAGTKKNILKVIGIATKMYSVYNVMLPAGYGFCIIDSSGLVVCHSDTARDLQENIFKESFNNYALMNAISHKDRIKITDIELYGNPVSMIVNPLEGLPYYLITFHQQRNANLFVFHIIAFAFVCGVLLFLAVSLFSYFTTLSSKSINKLFFEPEKLNWLIPSPEKCNAYVKNIMQLLSCVLLIYLISAFYHNNFYYLYILIATMFLPLFAVTGYYLIKSAQRFIDKHNIRSKFVFTRTYAAYLWYSRNILGLYALSVILFLIIKNTFFFNHTQTTNGNVMTGISLLLILVPFITTIIAATNPATNFIQRMADKYFSKFYKHKPNYLQYFIISLLLAVTLISVVPALNLVSYGFYQERKLQLQSSQVDLAKKIQARRLDVNPMLWQTKMSSFLFNDSGFASKDASLASIDIPFFDSLKFSTNTGIYLLPGDALRTCPDSCFLPQQSNMVTYSPFYKIVTRLLFLPPDHDDFYNNISHKEYYYWIDSSGNKNSNDSLHLYYKNTTDYRNKSSVILSTQIPHTHLFKNINHNYSGLLLLIIVFILIILFYNVVYSTAKRLFLIDFFKDHKGNIAVTGGDTDWLKQCYTHTNLTEANRLLGTNNFSFGFLRAKENSLLKSDESFEAFVLEMQFALDDVFNNIWQRCKDTEKFCLYDFAADGFANYKNVQVLHKLFNKGLIVNKLQSGSNHSNIDFLSQSFRNYLITKENSDEIKKLTRISGRSSWNSFRSVFYIVLFAFAVFIFITQQQATQRLITILTSLGALLPAMLKLFDAASSSGKSSGRN